MSARSHTPISSQRLLRLLVAACTVSLAQAQGITDLNPFGGSQSAALGVNGTGSIVVGWYLDGSSVRAFRWNLGSVTDLGTFNGGTDAQATAVNAAGTVIVGFADDGQSGDRPHAFRWTLAGGLEFIGVLDPNGQSIARAVNASGNVVVGNASKTDAQDRAFRWEQGGIMEDLGNLEGGNWSYAAAAYGVNAAGDVVVGSSQKNVAGGPYYHAFRYTTTGGMQDLGTLNNGTTSVAKAANASGNVITGWATDGLNGHRATAFRWTPSENGMVALLPIVGGRFSMGEAINAAGDVIVGQGDDGDDFHGFRWSMTSGMQTIEQWLAANGVNVSPELTLNATGVNAAGDIVVGQLKNNHAYIARSGSGLIDVQDFSGSLAGSAPVPAFTIQDASLVMHGAHGHPVSTVLPGGKQDLWLTGDWGRGDHAELDGSLGTAEVGYARGITEGATLKVALGRTGSTQDTAHGGEVRSRGTYLLPELVVAFPGSRLLATFSASYTWGEVDIDRGYLNTGLQDHSQGSPDVRSTAARLRLDWQEAFGTGRATFTPFLSLTRIHTRIDAYTEHGGGFPAHWDARRESSTQSRLGLDARIGMSDRTALAWRAEYVHRFEKHGTRANGQILGLSAFSMPGLAYRRNWVSGGLGLEHTFGALRSSLMLTASTEGGDPTYWASGTLRWRF